MKNFLHSNWLLSSVLGTALTFNIASELVSSPVTPAQPETMKHTLHAATTVIVPCDTRSVQATWTAYDGVDSENPPPFIASFREQGKLDILRKVDGSVLTPTIKEFCVSGIVPA